MIGYKATDMNGCCRGFKFEVGKTYTKDTPKEELECCTDKVFHFCRELFAIEKESEYKLSEKWKILSNPEELKKADAKFRERLEIKKKAKDYKKAFMESHTG